MTQLYIYRYRIEFEGGPALNVFLAENDQEAVRAAFRVGAALAPHVPPITRLVVESVVVGPITGTGDCETTVDRGLYDSKDLDLSILEECPAFIVPSV